MGEVVKSSYHVGKDALTVTGMAELTGCLAGYMTGLASATRGCRDGAARDLSEAPYPVWELYPPQLLRWHIPEHTARAP